MKVWEALPLCRACSGRPKGRGKEGASQQFWGSDTAWQGRQMGEQVLHLPSTNSAEQSCHQTLKESSKLQHSPSLGIALALFPCFSLGKVPGPAPVLCSQPWSRCPAALRGSWSPLGHVLATCLVWWQICWQLGLSRSVTTAVGCGLHPRL